MKKVKWASTIALTAALLVGLIPGVALASSPEVRNTGAYAIGAVHFWKGEGPQYAQGLYDALIPPGHLSGWASTDGVYIGPGWCVRAQGWRNVNGSELSSWFNIYSGDTNGATHYLGSPQCGMDVKAFPLSDPGCRP